VKRISVILLGLFIFLVIVWGAWEATRWTVMRVYVDHDEIAIITNRFGETLPPDQRTVKEGQSYKGVREQVLGPGRYFFDPFRYEVHIAKQIVVSAGDPSKWDWDPLGNMKDPGSAPQVGIVTALEGKTPPDGAEVVDEGFKGIQKQVLTPGTYKINPVKYKVDCVPAIVVPPGSVGVVTRQIGTTTDSGKAPTTQGILPLVTDPHQRGILRDVLQPGVYYLNPRVDKVTIVPIGYDAITSRGDVTSIQANADTATASSIQFLTKDGYQVEADFTVVWGRSPADAPELVRNIGNVDRVADIVITPAMKAAAQNEGGKFSAKELIQGTTRLQFQEQLSAALEDHVRSRNLQVLLALIRNITVKDTATGRDATEGLLRTIQQANIEVERELTNQQKTLTATTKAQYEQALKQVDVAKETIASETQVKVANLLADGEKQAAQIAAQTEVEIARIRAQVAQLDAQRTQILGKADADVLRLKNDAQAQGDKMLVDAFGSGKAYNAYIFAKNFNPTDLKLIFAGPGTLWTDLKTWVDINSASGLSDPKK
jgi:regulator of protease activity HflC (stomatin/prohibitin superfamily)